MKHLFIIGLFMACSMNIEDFHFDNKTTSFKAGQACGNCTGECGPKKLELA